MTVTAALRVGHAERQQAIELVKAAYADGRLDRDELEDRAGRALSARTTSDLDAVLADLGGGSAIGAFSPTGQPAPPERPSRGALEQLARLSRCVFCCFR